MQPYTLARNSHNNPMLHRRYKPRWLYEILPYVYAGVGLATIVVLKNSMAVFSGLTLVSAGVIVWQMRRKHRAGPRVTVERRAESASVYGDVANYDSRLLRVVWRSKYECGHPVIDAQHRRLVDLGNGLINSIVAGKPRPAVERLFDGLIAHIQEHFRTEEELLATTRHRVADDHRDSHRLILNQAVGLRRRYLADEKSAGHVIGFIAYEMIAQHIVKEDMSWVKAAGSLRS